MFQSFLTQVVWPMNIVSSLALVGFWVTFWVTNGAQNKWFARVVLTLLCLTVVMHVARDVFLDVHSLTAAVVWSLVTVRFQDWRSGLAHR